MQHEQWEFNLSYVLMFNIQANQPGTTKKNNVKEIKVIKA